MKYVCLACRAEYEDRVDCCGACLRHEWLMPLPTRVDGREVALAPRQRAGIIASGALRKEDRPGPYGEPWASAWCIGAPAAIELVGPGGSGKSTLATQLALSAGRRLDVLYVSAEEGHASTLVDRLRRSGLDDLTGARVRISDARTMAELSDDLRTDRAPLVVIDSATELKAAPEALVTALLGRSWIVVSHVNSRGRTYGGESMSHAVDVVIDVADGVATPRKSRFPGKVPLRIWPEESAA